MNDQMPAHVQFGNLLKLELGTKENMIGNVVLDGVPGFVVWQADQLRRPLPDLVYEPRLGLAVTFISDEEIDRMIARLNNLKRMRGRKAGPDDPYIVTR